MAQETEKHTRRDEKQPSETPAPLSNTTTLRPTLWGLDLYWINKHTCPACQLTATMPTRVCRQPNNTC